MFKVEILQVPFAEQKLDWNEFPKKKKQFVKKSHSLQRPTDSRFFFVSKPEKNYKHCNPVSKFRFN